MKSILFLFCVFGSLNAQSNSPEIVCSSDVINTGAWSWISYEDAMNKIKFKQGYSISSIKKFMAGGKFHVQISLIKVSD